MIKDFRRNIALVAAAPIPFSEKVSAFFSLTRLFFKIRMYRKMDAEGRESFPGIRRINGYYLALDYLYKEIFLGNEYYFKTANKNPVIIDCGGNIGMAVLYFKKLYPGAKILSFEANPGGFKLLSKNLSNNNIQNVELFQVALLDEEKEISFYALDTLTTITGSVKQSRGGGDTVKVQAKKLSSYIKDIETIDLIKIDIEGAEINVVDDLVASGCLTKAKEYIIEYHHNIDGENSKLSIFIEKFERHGYNYTIKAVVSNPKGFQDILIHFYKREG